MKTNILKQLIKEAVKEVFQEEMRDILLEAVRSNKQPINESLDSKTRTMDFGSMSQKLTPVINTKQAYMDILSDIARGPKNGLEGEFKINGNVDVVNGSLPEGQLGIDQIMNLIK
jgi:hypothetical protein